MIFSLFWTKCGWLFGRWVKLLSAAWKRFEDVWLIVACWATGTQRQSYLNKYCKLINHWKKQRDCIWREMLSRLRGGISLWVLPSSAGTSATSARQINLDVCVCIQMNDLLQRVLGGPAESPTRKECVWWWWGGGRYKKGCQRKSHAISPDIQYDDDEI